MSLHLHPVEVMPSVEPLPHIDPVFFVIQRGNGHWSPGSKIITVTDDEQVAEQFAAQQKKLHPQQHFCIAKLVSEIHNIEHIQIVRTVEGLA
jgi:hypothetical protein